MKNYNSNSSRSKMKGEKGAAQGASHGGGYSGGYGGGYGGGYSGGYSGGYGGGYGSGYGGGYSGGYSGVHSYNSGYYPNTGSSYHKKKNSVKYGKGAYDNEYTKERDKKGKNSDGRPHKNEQSSGGHGNKGNTNRGSSSRGGPNKGVDNSGHVGGAQTHEDLTAFNLNKNDSIFEDVDKINNITFGHNDNPEGDFSYTMNNNLIENEKKLFKLNKLDNKNLDCSDFLRLQERDIIDSSSAHFIKREDERDPFFAHNKEEQRQEQRGGLYGINEKKVPSNEAGHSSKHMKNVSFPSNSKQRNNESDDLFQFDNKMCNLTKFINKNIFYTNENDEVKGDVMNDDESVESADPFSFINTPERNKQSVQNKALSKGGIRSTSNDKEHMQKKIYPKGEHQNRDQEDNEFERKANIDSYRYNENDFTKIYLMNNFEHIHDSNTFNENFEGDYLHMLGRKNMKKVSSSNNVVGDLQMGDGAVESVGMEGLLPWGQDNSEQARMLSHSLMNNAERNFSIRGLNERMLDGRNHELDENLQFLNSLRNVYGHLGEEEGGTGVPGMPGMSALPGMSSLPGMSAMPSVRDLKGGRSPVMDATYTNDVHLQEEKHNQLRQMQQLRLAAEENYLDPSRKISASLDNLDNLSNMSSLANLTNLSNLANLTNLYPFKENEINDEFLLSMNEKKPMYLLKEDEYYMKNDKINDHFVNDLRNYKGDYKNESFIFPEQEDQSSEFLFQMGPTKGIHLGEMHIGEDMGAPRQEGLQLGERLISREVIPPREDYTLRNNLEEENYYANLNEKIKNVKEDEDEDEDLLLFNQDGDLKLDVTNDLNALKILNNYYLDDKENDFMLMEKNKSSLLSGELNLSGGAGYPGERYLGDRSPNGRDRYPGERSPNERERYPGERSPNEREGHAGERSRNERSPLERSPNERMSRDRLQANKPGGHKVKGGPNYAKDNHRSRHGNHFEKGNNLTNKNFPSAHVGMLRDRLHRSTSSSGYIDKYDQKNYFYKSDRMKNNSSSKAYQMSYSLSYEGGGGKGHGHALRNVMSSEIYHRTNETNESICESFIIRLKKQHMLKLTSFLRMSYKKTNLNDLNDDLYNYYRFLNKINGNIKQNNYFFKYRNLMKKSDKDKLLRIQLSYMIINPSIQKNSGKWNFKNEAKNDGLGQPTLKDGREAGDGIYNDAADQEDHRDGRRRITGDDQTDGEADSVDSGDSEIINIPGGADRIRNNCLPNDDNFTMLYANGEEEKLYSLLHEDNFDLHSENILNIDLNKILNLTSSSPTELKGDDSKAEKEKNKEGENARENENTGREGAQADHPNVGDKGATECEVSKEDSGKKEETTSGADNKVGGQNDVSKYDNTKKLGRFVFATVHEPRNLITLAKNDPLFDSYDEVVEKFKNIIIGEVALEQGPNGESKEDASTPVKKCTSKGAKKDDKKKDDKKKDDKKKDDKKKEEKKSAQEEAAPATAKLLMRDVVTKKMLEMMWDLYIDIKNIYKDIDKCPYTHIETISKYNEEIKKKKNTLFNFILLKKTSDEETVCSSLMNSHNNLFLKNNISNVDVTANKHLYLYLTDSLYSTINRNFEFLIYPTIADLIINLSFDGTHVARYVKQGLAPRSDEQPGDVQPPPKGSGTTSDSNSGNTGNTGNTSNISNIFAHRFPFKDNLALLGSSTQFGKVIQFSRTYCYYNFGGYNEWDILAPFDSTANSRTNTTANGASVGAPKEKKKKSFFFFKEKESKKSTNDQTSEEKANEALPMPPNSMRVHNEVTKLDVDTNNLNEELQKLKSIHCLFVNIILKKKGACVYKKILKVVKKKKRMTLIYSLFSNYLLLLFLLAHADYCFENMLHYEEFLKLQLLHMNANINTLNKFIKNEKMQNIFFMNEHEAHLRNSGFHQFINIRCKLYSSNVYSSLYIYLLDVSLSYLFTPGIGIAYVQSILALLLYYNYVHLYITKLLFYKSGTALLTIFLVKIIPYVKDFDRNLIICFLYSVLHSVFYILCNIFAHRLEEERREHKGPESELHMKILMSMPNEISFYKIVYKSVCSYSHQDSFFEEEIASMLEDLGKDPIVKVIMNYIQK
ncbi:hypothetical protein PCYB_133780 [Plasmodium cynomolgi strain B]|uniref:Uncharacterized protein n=1 Tax=Plasmodium cynomolgi (strain B) TaxID=1120755 RepID=K6UXM6_PLACD|nr:hypothetical protein PCYB_133780 [Plasmodium cynomolgi strain B]GAB68504.1 hypothetical protein PCYB_133780 [Plasmodium cynomolgi strain B]